MDPTGWLRCSMLVCAVVLFASPGNASNDEPKFLACLKTCGTKGCAGNSCLSSCHYLNTSGEGFVDSLPVYGRWKDWVCSSECRYHCLLSRDTEVAGLEQEAIGYRHNWCLLRVMYNQENSDALYRHLAKSLFIPGTIRLGLINEPASVAFAALNMIVNLLGLVAFLKLVHYDLPRRPLTGRSYYPFAGLWTLYGLLVSLYWFSQCVLHARSMAFDKNIESTLEVVLATSALLLAVVRIGDLRSEQSRVIVIAPSIAFSGPHLFYINLCTYEYGLNILVCFALGCLLYIAWITWATVTKHPARYQLYLLTLLAPLTLLLRLYDFSYLWEGLDSDALWIAATIPSSFIWWNFVRTDAAYLTKVILKKKEAAASVSVEPKKER